MKVPEFDKHLKKAGGHIGRNVVEIPIKMKTIVRKPLMIKNTDVYGNLNSSWNGLLFASELQTTFRRLDSRSSENTIYEKFCS